MPLRREMRPFIAFIREGGTIRGVTPTLLTCVLNFPAHRVDDGISDTSAREWGALGRPCLGGIFTG
jgi:hypothetical protein